MLRSPGVIRMTVRRTPLFAAVLLVACHDAQRDTMLTPRPSAELTTIGLAVDGAPSADGTVTVAIRVSPAISLGALGSLTASIDYDTAAIRFDRDISVDDGALRAVHDDQGRVRVAVAAAAGLPLDVVARLRFSVRRPEALRTALPSLALQVIELHQLDAHDAKAGVTVLPVTVTR